MNRIAIAGAAGRMGRNLVLACAEADDLELTQALERGDSPLLGSDSGLLAGIDANQVVISERLDPDAPPRLRRVASHARHGRPDREGPRQLRPAVIRGTPRRPALY